MEHMLTTTRSIAVLDAVKEAASVVDRSSSAPSRLGCRPSRLATVAALVVASGLAGPATAARAAQDGDTVVEEATFTVAAYAQGEAGVTCPAGRRVVGGGVGTTAPTVNSYVQVSGPLGPTGLTVSTVDGDIARSWYANVHNFGEARTYKVFALCSATSDAVVEEASYPIPANAAGEGGVTCPAGRRVVGGGIGTTAATVNSSVQVSGPLGPTGLTASTNDGDIARSWYANVYNIDEARTYKVFALCSATSDAIVEEASYAMPANAEGEGGVTCPAGRRVVGGGVGTTAATVNSAVQVSGPLGPTGLTATTIDGNVARSWYAKVKNAGLARTYKVLALCASDPAAAPAPVSPRPSPGSPGSPESPGSPGNPGGASGTPSGPVVSFAGSPTSVRVASTGRFSYRFHATARSTGKIRLVSSRLVKVGSKKRKLAVPWRSFTAPANATVRVNLTLSRSNLNALRRARRMQFRVTVTLGGRRFAATVQLRAGK